ncbi:histidinol-phosphatase [Hoeflea prorocentri]|uniref:Histidinol-phosphatase n=1 Tax=Hoeflea prorocentri TaxID=1922333 RepID=A0A9X3UEL7_9HYPH|nr:histidinol-phosphatase [Hoeflea prorocentri]MCY6379238.1 histidinol-phosphatase [Hoeflea prorocentri]MDA5397039.1 histidinol-phosphatase [Hoeflea prorocentri]
MQPDLDFFHELADAAAKETLPRFRTNAAVTNKLESGFDPVTEADRSAEAAIRALIKENFPDHGIMGEEYGSEGLDAEYVWVIDPVDGTRAFISGLPVWGTLIGLYRNGRSIAGLMDQPFTGERYLADQNGAIYRGPDGQRTIHARDCGDLSAATLFTTSPHLFLPEEFPFYRAVEERVNLFRYGCDCYAYTLVAAGHADLVIENGLQAYDVGGLIAILEAAGAVMTDWQGGRPEQGGNIIAAGSRTVHAEALELLNG